MREPISSRRFPILWRFIITIILLLIFPVIIVSLILQFQLKEDFNKRLLAILQGNINSLEAGLRSEMLDTEATLSRIALDPDFRDQIFAMQNLKELNQSIMLLERRSHSSLLFWSDSNSLPMVIGNQGLDDHILKSPLLSRANSQPYSYFHAHEGTVLVVALQKIYAKNGRSFIIGLVNEVRNSLFDSIGATFFTAFSIIDQQNQTVLFTSSLAHSIQTSLGSYSLKQTITSFLKSQEKIHFQEALLAGTASYYIFKRSDLPFDRAIIMHVVMPRAEMQPFDYSGYLLLLSAMTVLLAAISSWTLLRRVVNPLTYLSSEVNKLRLALRQSTAVKSIHLESNDEINDVASTFNDLVFDLLENRQKIEEQRAQIVSYAHNLEERVHDRTRELEEAKLRAELASTQKSRFLVNMNHELRTPLNSISGITELLRFGAYEKNEEFSDLLTELIDQLSIYTSISADTLEFLREMALRLKGEGNTKHSLVETLVNRYPDNFMKADLAEIINRLDSLAIEEKASTRKAYGTIRDASNSLLNIINEVINLSRIESGVIEVHLERTRIQDVINVSMNHAEAYLRVKGKDKKLEFNLAIDESVPEYLLIDNQKIKQVLLNFLTNAIKYSNSGIIKVQVDTLKIVDSPMVRFMVHDTGIGIAEKDRSQLFLEFARVFEVRDIEGSGLGLSLSRKLVERMGGEINFESEFGKGSTFWFTVPLNRT